MIVLIIFQGKMPKHSLIAASQTLFFVIYKKTFFAFWTDCWKNTSTLNTSPVSVGIFHYFPTFYRHLKWHII